MVSDASDDYVTRCELNSWMHSTTAFQVSTAEFITQTAAFMNGLFEKVFTADGVVVPRSLLVQQQLQLQTLVMENQQLKGKLAFYCFTNQMLQNQFAERHCGDVVTSNEDAGDDPSGEMKMEARLNHVVDELSGLSSRLEESCESIADSIVDLDLKLDLEDSDCDVMDVEEKLSLCSQIVHDYSSNIDFDNHFCDNLDGLSDDGSLSFAPSVSTEAESLQSSLMPGNFHVRSASFCGSGEFHPT